MPLAYNEAQKAMALNDADFLVICSMSKFQDYWNGERAYNKCRATPLLGLFGADGNIHLCCDRRGHKGMILGSYNGKKRPIYYIKKLWGSEEHRELIKNIKLSECPRCRYTKYNEIIENVFIKDNMHRNFL